ncbi:MAG: hypothetical protein R3C11_21205 [Planctomycetaceae bacterium]
MNVKIGDSKKTIVYRLVKKEDSSKWAFENWKSEDWVVDEVYLKQSRDSHLRVTKK